MLTMMTGKLVGDYFTHPLYDALIGVKVCFSVSLANISPSFLDPNFSGALVAMWPAVLVYPLLGTGSFA